MKPAIGVLALQGDFGAHAQALADSGARPREIRRTDQLVGLAGLVLPGGESTTLLRLMREYGFDTALPQFVRDGGALYGTCAGAILLAREVTSPAQWSLDLIDITVQRNGYGRQADSFETSLGDVDASILDAGPGGPDASPLPAVFIRAPRIVRAGPSTTVLATREGEAVIVREGPILVSTFHPELTEDRRLPRYFLEHVVAASPAARGC